MDAFFARNRLSAYLDGSLSATESAELEEVLARDPALRAEVDAMRRTISLLREVGPTQAPHGFHARVMAQVSAQPVPRGVLAWLRKPLASLPIEALALAAAALIVVIAIQLRPTPLPPPTPAPVVADASVSEPPPAPAAPEQSTMPTVELGRGVPLGADSGTKTRASKPRPIPTPSEPFQPDWEKAEVTPTAPPEAAESDASLSTQSTQALTNGVGMRSALYYRVSDGPPDVLSRLVALAQQTGGQLVDKNGQPVSPRDLTVEQNYAEVQLIIPSGALSDTTAALRKLGAAANPPPSGSALYAADSVTIHLELTYKP